MNGETKARMFDPFFSTRFQGRGLGLAAVAGLVRAHGGAIRVVSSPGRGTSVTVLFPIADRQPERPAVVTEWVAASAEPGTILVIDDDTAVLELASAALRYAGHRVIAAESAFEGIALLGRQASEIDLILLDLNMPGMSGHEALPRLFAIAPEVDVLISSGYTEADALERLAGAPVSGVINKPYGARVLTDRVNAVLTARRRNRNHAPQA
jgi:CheY-like chemotaxis protein